MLQMIFRNFKSLYTACKGHLLWHPILKIWRRIHEDRKNAKDSRKKVKNGIYQQYFQLNDLNMCIEHCLFFGDPDNTGGHLSLRGWIADKKPVKKSHPGQKYDIKIVFDKQTDARVHFNVERPDVQNQFCHTPIKCGFDIQIPTQAPMNAIAIFSYRPLKDKYISDLSVYNVDNFMSADRYQALPALGKKKLENLILNEKERLHKCIKLNSRPLHFYIDPSFACNLQCPHCHGEKMRKAGYHLPNLTENALTKILDEFGESLVQVYFANWGEPLLNKNFPKLVQKLKSYQIWVHTSSNLSLHISDSQMDDIIKSGLDFLILSVDGVTQDVYEKYRKNGNLDLVLTNIKRLVKRKQELNSTKPVLEWQILDFPWNRHQIEASRRMATQIGVDRFKCIPGDIHEDMVPSLGQRVDKAPVQMDMDRQQALKKIARKKQLKYEYFGCDHLYKHLCIYADGSTHPCYNVIAPEHKIGNIFEEGGDRVFNGKYQMANRKLFKGNGPDKIWGYDPCLNCDLITGKGEHRGHSFSALDFSIAFKAITGAGIYDFI